MNNRTSPITFDVPPGFGLRQSSGAFPCRMGFSKRQRLPQSELLARSPTSVANEGDGPQHTPAALLFRWLANEAAKLPIVADTLHRNLFRPGRPFDQHAHDDFTIGHGLPFEDAEVRNAGHIL